MFKNNTRQLSIGVTTINDTKLSELSLKFCSTIFFSVRNVWYPYSRYNFWLRWTRLGFFANWIQFFCSIFLITILSATGRKMKWFSEAPCYITAYLNTYTIHYKFKVHVNSRKTVAWLANMYKLYLYYRRNNEEALTIFHFIPSCFLENLVQRNSYRIPISATSCYFIYIYMYIGLEIWRK